MIKPKEDLKNQYKQSFTARIWKNKKQLSINLAQSLSENYVSKFKLNNYQQNKSAVQNYIETYNITSQEIIRKLDEEFLIDYGLSDIEYIIDHKGSLNRYVRSQLKSIKEYILQTHQSKFNELLKQSIDDILNNLNQLLNKLPNLTIVSDYFKEADKYQENYFENILYEIVLEYLQGNESLHINLMKVEYQDIFRQIQIQQVQLNHNLKLTEIQQIRTFISQLFPFLLEFEVQLNKFSTYQKYEELNLESFEIERQLAELEQQMLGCQEICPLCGRKCDQNNLLNFEHKHGCRNGHQIRGMKGVLLQGKPSLYLCEELQDDDVIVVKSTNIMIKWNEYKKNLCEWDFEVYDKIEFQQKQVKMLNLWNRQIGRQFCANNKLIFEQKMLDQRYHYEHEENAHYILVIEDSIWINDDEWEYIQLATFQIMKKILKSEFSKLSLIQYNQEARVVIDCDFVNQPFQPLIRNPFPQANFELAVDQILILLNNYLNQGFQKYNKNLSRIIVILLTKGLLEFPEKQIEALFAFQNLKQSLMFRFYSLSEFDLNLEKVVEMLKKQYSDVESYLIQNSDFIKEIWSEKATFSQIFQQ